MFGVPGRPIAPRARPPLRAISAALPSLLVAICGGPLGGCDGGGYTLEARFASEPLAAEASAVELFVLPSCEGAPLPQGGDPSDALARVYLERGGEIGGLTPLPEGDYGLYGRARDAACGVIATGCAPISVERGGSGTLRVELEPTTGPGCGANRSCRAGRCVPGGVGADAGPFDAGFIDAGSTDAGSTDAGSTDAGSTDAGSTDGGPGDAGVLDACVLRSEYADGILAASPLYYYRLGEAESGAEGAAALEVIGGADGVYEGSVTLGAAGALPGDPDPAVAFGAGPSPGSMRLPSTTHPAFLAPELSFELWLRAPARPAAGERLPVLFADAPGLSGFRFGLDEAGHLIFWTTDSATTGGELATEATLDTGWHHVAVTVSLFTVRVYIDGAREAFDTVIRSGGGSSEVAATLGAGRGLAGELEVDELAIYDRVLTPSVVDAHYALGLSATAGCDP